jgi:L-threonylcarbamoyladenylate synthase
MKTQIVDASKIFIAAELLKKGEPIVFPTETVYGLGAAVFLPESVAKIFSIKGRPSDNPLIVHVSSIEQALTLTEDLPPSFFLLANRFWPGPLTFVLKRNPLVPQIVSAGQSTIAIRMPSHPIALELIRAVGSPLAAPSANLSGRPSPTCAQDAAEDLDGKVPLILDGGACAIGIESTVLSLVGPEPVLLRPGQITKEELEEVLQRKIGLPSSEIGAPLLSPGMKYRHYAPKAHLRLVYNRSELRGACVFSRVPMKGEKLLSKQTLFAEFRQADRRGERLIEIYCDPMIEKDTALMNRLLKASATPGEYFV